MTGPLRTSYNMGCWFYFLAAHVSKGLAQECAGYCQKICDRSCISAPPSCHYKVEVPKEAATIWVDVVFFPLRIAEDTSRQALKRKFESKVILSICVVFLFPRPPLCLYKITGFLPSTYWVGVAVGAFFPSFSKIKFKT